MDTLAAPLGELIIAIGRSVADAQATLDGRVLEHFGAIYDQSAAAFEPLRAIRYQPTWYHVSEATAQIALALTVTRSQGGAQPTRRDVLVAPVDGEYASRFTYRHRSASSLTFRIVPVPEPAAAAIVAAGTP